MQPRSRTDWRLRNFRSFSQAFAKANRVSQDDHQHHSRIQTIPTVLGARVRSDTVGTRRHTEQVIPTRLPCGSVASPRGTLPPYSTLCGIRQAPPSWVEEDCRTTRRQEDHPLSLGRSPPPQGPTTPAATLDSQLTTHDWGGHIRFTPRLRSRGTPPTWGRLRSSRRE